MSTAVICKSFTFDAAHQLPHHSSKCARLHGHTYKVEITLSGEVQSANGSSSEGMVVDFDVVTQIYKRYIDAAVDHKFMIPGRNPAVKLQNTQNNRLLFTLGTSVYDLPAECVAVLPIENTTAEHISAWILQEMRRNLSSVVAVRVYETPTSYAEAVYGGD